MASVTLLTGGSVPKGLESPMKERKVTRITDIVRKKNSMTDKVQKIREEVERLQIELIQEKENGFGSDADDACFLELQNVLTYIDSLQEEPVNEELEEEIDNYVKRNGYDGLDSIEEVKYIANHFAKWQKEQMMKNATDVTVHIDAGGYPYTPEIELYDYDKDVPLAKEGDKYKVVLIKED